MKKKLALITLAIALLGASTYYYILYGGARNLASEDAEYTVSSKNIVNEFNANVEKSNAKYLEKAIAIKGIVSTVNAKQVILDNTIICDCKEIDTTIKKGQELTLKGRFVGYDDLMGELKLDQCAVINNN